MFDLFELNNRPTKRDARYFANDLHLKEASLWRIAERRSFWCGQDEALR
jgi:hypothetical protein